MIWIGVATAAVVLLVLFLAFHKSSKPSISVPAYHPPVSYSPPKMLPPAKPVSTLAPDKDKGKNDESEQHGDPHEGHGNQDKHDHKS